MEINDDFDAMINFNVESDLFIAEDDPRADLIRLADPPRTARAKH